MEDLFEVFNIEIGRYFLDGGDEIIRYNYSLGPDSVVFDVGGYVGDFTEIIYNKFGSNVYLFEPVKAYYKICKNRFLKNPNIRVNRLGISGNIGDYPIYINGDTTSSNSDSDINEIVKTTTLYESIRMTGVERINLLKLNIEGDEYNLLERAIIDRCIDKVDNMQIQYHININNCVERRKKIAEELKKTHILEWKYDWVWESWKKK